MRKIIELDYSAQEVREMIQSAFENHPVMAPRIREDMNNAAATFKEGNHAAGFRWTELPDGKTRLSIEGRNEESIEAIQKIVLG